MIRNETSRMITDAKENCFSTLGRKLSNPIFGLKTYWATLNRIINKKRDDKYTLTGFNLLGGRGEASPRTSQLPPPKKFS